MRAIDFADPDQYEAADTFSQLAMDPGQGPARRREPPSEMPCCDFVARNGASVAKHHRVRTALLLAAGTGRRLSPLTDSAHKSLTEVNGVPILRQQIACLEQWGFEHLIVVVGHQGEQIRDFLEGCVTDLKVEYVHNPQYQTTNNVYSLWLARESIEQPFLLLECDLFFEAGLLADMRYPDRVAVATKQPWMHGTTVTLDDSQQVVAFQLGNSVQQGPAAYKTVNIYSLSLSTWHEVRRRLESHISSGRVNDYYEAIFHDMAADGTLNLHAVSFDRGNWYEIDTLKDLRLAERLFAEDVALLAPPRDSRFPDEVQRG
jgi:choline kinase